MDREQVVVQILISRENEINYTTTKMGALYSYMFSTTGHKYRGRPWARFTKTHQLVIL